MVDDAGDRRDDELARALTVTPLDEVTRRRMVAHALDAAAPTVEPRSAGRGKGRWVAAAAAVAFAALGVLALVLPSGETAQVAGRAAPRQEATPSVASADASGAADTPDTSTGASPALGVPLGDFGNLADPATRRRLLVAIDRAAIPQPASPSGTRPTDSTACPVAGLSGEVATATGNFDGRPTMVAVTRRDDGTLRVRLVISEPCEVRELR